MSQSQQQSGPPYVPNQAPNGGQPSESVDIPITAVLMVFYIFGAIGNMTILQVNNRRSHKFLLSGALFGFCMSRILTTALRLGVVTHPSNVSLNIAAQIFLNAGVLLAYIIGALLSHRLLRSQQPHLGWNPIIGHMFKALYVLLAVALALVIAFTVLTFYTLDTGLRNDAMWIQRAAILYLLLFNLVSATLYLLAVLLPTHPKAEEFGKKGSMKGKKIIIGWVLALCVLEAGYRTGTTWSDPRPVNDPAWYQSKASFYVFYFVVEILIIYTLMLTRFDLRFWVPNGSEKPGDYSNQYNFDFKFQDPESRMTTTGARTG